MTLDRRSTDRGDQVQQQIEELIVAATDPKDKAFLLIMNKIATSLDTNTALTRALSTDFKAHTTAFEDHERKEMALINQGRGGFRVAMGLLGVLQILIGFVITNTLADLKDIRQELTILQREVAVQKEHLVQDERRKAASTIP